MNILEILEAHHKIDWDDWGYRRCRCGFQFAPKYSATAHRAHVAEVLDKLMQEREAAAFKSGFDHAHNQHTAHQARRNQPYPPISYTNPYRQESRDGRE